MSNSVQDHSMEQQQAERPVDEKVEKGKGKMTESTAMDEEDDDEDDYEEAEGEVEEADEDNMEEIDEDNIVGRRTRGKTIDFAEAAKNLDEDEDDDEDDDDDFQEEDEDTSMAD